MIIKNLLSFFKKPPSLPSIIDESAINIQNQIETSRKKIEEFLCLYVDKDGKRIKIYPDFPVKRGENSRKSQNFTRRLEENYFDQ